MEWVQHCCVDAVRTAAMCRLAFSFPSRMLCECCESCGGCVGIGGENQNENEGDWNDSIGME